MTRTVLVEVENSGTFKARRGMTLLDAALLNGIDLPHDCRAGVCGTCRVDVVSGRTLGGDCASAGSVLACQAKLASDLRIAVDDLPAIETISGKVRSVEAVAEDVVEVTIAPRRPFEFLPGQYAQFKFAGYPMRCFSPTVPLEGAVDKETIRLHVRRVRDGRVSGALGKDILPGHKVKITGPFGSAYLRPGRRERLVLVASGTGFAPIWAIAHAALCEMPDRPIVVVAGARTVESFYAVEALVRLSNFPKVEVRPVLSRSPLQTRVFRIGCPSQFMPELTPDDTVYVCGSPTMVRSVEHKAKLAGAACHADPFVPAAPERQPILARAREWLRPSAPELLQAAE